VCPHVSNTEKGKPGMTKAIVAKLFAVFLGLSLAGGPAAAQNAPVVAFDSLLNTYFDASNGTVAFESYDFAFAPDEPLNAQVALVDSSNTVLAAFPFFDTYRVRNGVFGRALVQGTPAYQLTEPGIYNIVVLVDGKPVSRLGVALVQTSAGDDPFKPQKTYRFDGLWRSHAYFTMTDSGEKKIPKLNLWVGSIDLPQGKARDAFGATLLRDGERVAHTKEDLGFLAAGHFDWQRIGFFHPHERKNAANARAFTATDLVVDGSYVIEVKRASDGKLLRSYDFQAAGGKLVPLPETQFGFQPGIDYLLPRTVNRGSSDYEFVEAFWIKGGAN